MAVKVKLKVKKGDTVKVISGNSKGKSGKVLKVYKDTQRVLVEGVNIVTKHVKPTPQETSGRIDKKEAPIHISNVAVTVKGEVTKVGRKLEDGKIVRFAKKTGETI